MQFPRRAQVVAAKDQRKCIETIAKEGAKYVVARLKERSKCADKNLKATGSCDTAKRDEKLAKAESKLKAGIDKKCGADAFASVEVSLQVIGFPGKCPPIGAPFTDDELEACIFETQRDVADMLFDLEYGANGDDAVVDFETQTGSTATAKNLRKCQKEIATNSQKFVKTIMKEVQKCRNGLQSGKLAGFLPADCADNPIETKPKQKIDKVETALRAKIASKCTTDALIVLLDACDTGSGPQVTTPELLDCLVATHRDACDNPDQEDTADLIDIFGLPGRRGLLPQAQHRDGSALQ